MERNNSEKLDSLISEVVKLSAVMSDISKEVHSVNNRMTGIEAVLNGINGSGGMVKDLANLGEKLSRLGGEHNNLDKQVAKIEISHNDLKEDVREFSAGREIPGSRQRRSIGVQSPRNRVSPGMIGEIAIRCYVS